MTVAFQMFDLFTKLADFATQCAQLFAHFTHHLMNAIVM